MARMTFGNNIGITMENFDPELDYATRLGSIVCEINGVLDPSIAQLTFVRVLGSTTVEQEIAYQSTKRSGQESFCISIEDAYVAWSETLE
ncbi:MAG: hypothetical protein KDF65_16795 [Anaerolineae bacterium]|nr:hypothetical protein [Anaerolineae bacterium]